jgi:hypothetical protein
MNENGITFHKYLFIMLKITLTAANTEKEILQWVLMNLLAANNDIPSTAQIKMNALGFK